MSAIHLQEKSLHSFAKLPGLPSQLGQPGKGGCTRVYPEFREQWPCEAPGMLCGGGSCEFWCRDREPRWDFVPAERICTSLS